MLFIIFPLSLSLRNSLAGIKLRRGEKKDRRKEACAWSHNLVGKRCEEIFEKNWIPHLKSSSSNLGDLSEM